MRWARAERTTSLLIALLGLGPFVLAGILAVVYVRADPQGEDLRWRIENNQSFCEEESTETAQKMKVQGMDVDQKLKQAIFYRWVYREQDKDNNWVLQQTIASADIEIEIGGQKISCNSANRGASSPQLAGLFQALLGCQTTLTLSPEMKVLKVEATKLPKTSPQLTPFVDQLHGQSVHKQEAEMLFGWAPPGRVKPGDSWSRQSELSLGPIGSYHTTATYTYEGREGKLDRIQVAIILKYQPPAADTDCGLPFRLKKSDLQSGKETSAMIWFNPERGRLEWSELHLVLKGKLTIEIGGMETEVELLQTQKTVVKIIDGPPVRQ